MNANKKLRKLIIYFTTVLHVRFAVSKNNPSGDSIFSVCKSRRQRIVITYHHEQLCDINLTYDTQYK